MVEKILAKTGELIEFNPSVKHQKDTKSLCGARHEVQIGVTKTGGGLKPFDDYFIVRFEPADTSGGGDVMIWLGKQAAKIMESYESGVLSGAKMFIDPKDYMETVGGGLAQYSREHGVVYGEGVVGNIAVGVKETGDVVVGVGKAIGSGAKKAVCGRFNPLCAETDYALYAEQEKHSSPTYTPLGFNVEEPSSFVGTHYHGLEGDTHKIRITITNTFDGKTVTRYQSDLAGCRATYETDDDCTYGESYKRFLINSPGEWTITVEPLATATCSPISYTETATYTVPEPEGWKPSEISVMSTNISLALQEAGVPVFISPVMLVAGISLVGGLVLMKFYKKKKG